MHHGTTPGGLVIAESGENGRLAGRPAQAVLEKAEMFWLSTVRRGGRPHVVPLPAMWLDGALHFCTGPQEQEARGTSPK